MKKFNFNEEKIVKVTYTNPIGMQVTVKKAMSDAEIKEFLHEGKASLNKIIA